MYRLRRGEQPSACELSYGSKRRVGNGAKRRAHAFIPEAAERFLGAAA
jgi:hypothetical protein